MNFFIPTQYLPVKICLDSLGYTSFLLKPSTTHKFVTEEAQNQSDSFSEIRKGKISLYRICFSGGLSTLQRQGLSQTVLGGSPVWVTLSPTWTPENSAKEGSSHWRQSLWTVWIVNILPSSLLTKSP